MKNVRAAVLLVAMGLYGCRQEPPPGACTVSPASLDFGLVDTTSPAKALRVLIRNGTNVPQQVTVTPLSFPFATHPAEPVQVRAQGLQEVMVTFKPTDGRLSLDELVIRSEDGACDVAVPVKGLGSGSLRANPPELKFTLGKGESETREVRIENTRRVSVSFDVSVTPPSTFTAPEGQELAPGASVPVLVTGRLDDWAARRGVLIVTGTLERLEVPIEMIPSSPRLEVTPLPIDIPVVDLDSSSVPPGFAERVVRLRNAGASMDPNVPKLAVTDVVVANNPLLNEVVVRKEMFTLLGENQSTDLSIRFTPKALGPHTFQFHRADERGQLHRAGDGERGRSSGVRNGGDAGGQACAARGA